jgi:hypothetical protein
VRSIRALDADQVALVHDPSRHDDPHDPGEADQRAALVAPPRRLHEPGLQAVQLPARIAQPGDLDDRLLADVQRAPAREREEVEATSRDVLSHEPDVDLEPLGAKVDVQLRREQMDLTQVRLGGIAREPAQVLHRGATMRIALDAETREQPDALPCLLADRVLRAQVNGDDMRIHDAIVPYERSRLLDICGGVRTVRGRA